MKYTRFFIPVLIFLLAIISFNSCNDYYSQNTSTVNVELPSDLFEILNSKTTANRATTNSEFFVVTATMSGSVTQTQTQTYTLIESSEPITIEFKDIPLNSVITVEVTIESNNIVLYSGKSTETIINNLDTTIDISLLPILKTYIITYDANNATGGTIPEPQIKTQGTPLTLALNSGNLVKTGYSFVGWNTAENGKGTSYAEGTSYIANESITLYAQWTALPTYTITYDANGATGGNSSCISNKKT